MNIDAVLANADWPKRTPDRFEDLGLRILGGPGSGNFGHLGRPGKVGGSTKWKGNAPVHGTPESREQQRLADTQKNPLAHPAYAFGYDSMEADLQPAATRYIAAYGQEFKSQPRPKDVPKGTPNECYKNASLLMIGRDDLTYAEGFAMKEPGGLAIFHAWLVDAEGNVVDPTLEDSENWHYFGVKYDRSKYMKHLFKARFHGVIGGTDETARNAIANGGRDLR